MIIDCHCHAGLGDGLTGPWDTRAPLKDFMRRAREVGIHAVNVFAAFNSDYRRANLAIAKLVQRHPERFFGFAFVHPTTDAGRVDAIGQWAVDAGLVGFKVHKHDAPITREICDVARRYRLPVLYDVTGEVHVCELLAAEYPQVNFIIPHLGSFADDWRAQLALIDHLQRHANIYADTAGVRRFDLLEQAVRRAGAHKVLFGSDGPWLHPGVELSKVHALELNARDERQIMGGNFLRLTREVRFSQQRRAARSPAASAMHGRSRRVAVPRVEDSLALLQVRAGLRSRLRTDPVL